MSTPPQTRGSRAVVAMDGDREPVLDGVRGLAVLLVLFHHLVVFSGIDRGLWIDLRVYKLADSTWLGVDLFFVLSGFLITGILYEAKGSSLFFRSFYGRRVLRIFPLYFGFLAFAVLVFPFWLPAESVRNLAEDQGWYWLYLSNVYVAHEGWQDPLHLGHFWSLAVEEQFYLLWPFAVWTLNRQWLMRLAVACFAGALSLRFIMPFGIDELGAHVLLPTRMDALAAGAFMALAIRGRRGIQILGRWPAAIFLAGSAALLVHFLRHDAIGYYQPIERTVGYSVIACTFASLIALALTAAPRSWLRLTFSNGPLVFLGKYSYGLYVVHVPIVLFLRDAGFQAGQFPRLWGSTLPGVMIFAAVGAALSVACAVVVYHCWEEPFLRLKKYLPYRDERSRGAAGRPQVVT